MIAIVLPTHNEAAIIAATLDQLRAFLNDRVREHWRIVVADNGSTDTTRTIVRATAMRDPRVELLEIPEPGKGRAVFRAWRHAVADRQDDPYRSHTSTPTTSSDVFIFMDADLATDLRAFTALITAVRSGADIAVGSRVLPGATVERGVLRRFLAWGNRCMLRFLFDLHVSDPPCGFKAVNASVVREVVPLVRDTQWFADTELVIRAQRAGLRIVEIPVTWREPRHGGLLRKVARMITGNLRAMARLHHELRHELRAH